MNVETALEICIPSFEKEYREYIEEFHKTDKNNKKEKYVRCKLCMSMPILLNSTATTTKLRLWQQAKGAGIDIVMFRNISRANIIGRAK